MYDIQNVVTYEVSFQVRVSVLNTIVDDANFNVLSGDSRLPDGDDVVVSHWHILSTEVMLREHS